MQLTLLKHAFPFGSAVRADLIAGADDDSVKYSQTFYDNFDWCVLENDLKWRQMEWNRVRQHTSFRFNFILSSNVCITI